MSYQVLARKWRPKSFDKVVGQKHITRSLQNAITSGVLGHAYLFVGASGVGKTSVARIFAKMLRCKNLAKEESGENMVRPCGQCLACQDVESHSSMDVLEIDGASHNSVDHIRELVGHVHYLPSFGKYKITIIDEVHMLSSNAFNALLKTLEAPPSHVVFMFATTEPEKLLDTVISRCQRFDFRKISLDELISHVKDIGEKEKISFSNEKIIEKICLQGHGQVRNTLSVLEQVLNYTTDKRIDDQVVADALGLVRVETIDELATALLQCETKKCSQIYRGLLNENVSLENIVTALLDRLFEFINLGDGNRTAELFWIFETLAKDCEWGLNSLYPDKILEVILQKITMRRSFFNALQGDQKEKEEKVTAVPVDEVGRGGPLQEKLLNDPLLNEAKKIFNAKIGKVVMKSEEEIQ